MKPALITPSSRQQHHCNLLVFTQHSSSWQLVTLVLLSLSEKHSLPSCLAQETCTNYSRTGYY